LVGLVVIGLGGELDWDGEVCGVLVMAGWYAEYECWMAN